MYDSIMIPVDIAHTEKADTMIKTARRLGGDEAKITLLNVVEEIPAYIANEMPGNVIETSMAHARDVLQKIAGSAGGNVEVDVLCGQVTTKILEHAADAKCDAIVVASHRPGLQDYFLGSTAARIVRHAQCSVIVVR